MPHNRRMTAIDNAPVSRDVPPCRPPLRPAPAPGPCAPVLLRPLPAATVYRTVDDNGVVGYSDTPPADEAEVEILVIDIPTPELSESARQQLEAMRETTDRMVADRQQREKHRRNCASCSSRASPGHRVSGAGDLRRHLHRILPYPAYPGLSPVYRPRPDHPTCRRRPHPRTASRRDIISPGYDYPASLVRRGCSPAVRAAFEQ